MGRPPGSRTGRVTLAECIALIDATERRIFSEIIPLVDDPVLDVAVDIADAMRGLLRRAGKRNGPITQ